MPSSTIPEDLLGILIWVNMEVCKPTKSIVDVTANSNLKVEIVECGLKNKSHLS